jgi:hypothetical protein
MGKVTYPRWKDEAIVGQIEAELAIGATWQHATTLAGVHPNTVKRWRNQVTEWGTEADTGLAAVICRLDVAKATGERKIVEDLLEGGPDGDGKGWQRLAWYLERTNPREFSVLEHFRGRMAEPEEADESARHEKNTVDEVRQAISEARTVIEAE